MSEITISERQIVGSERVIERDSLAEQFIEPAGSYFDLKPNPKLDGAADGYSVSISLLQPNAHSELLNKLGSAAENFFKFRHNFFRYSVGRPQRIIDLIKAPFSHADLEEEEIEEKFPDDIKRRALLKALNHVLIRNQARHILRKRTYQGFYTLAAAVLMIAWFVIGPSLCIEVLRRLSLPTPDPIVFGVWVGGFILIFIVSRFFLTWLYQRDLTNTTDRFKSSNRTACATASESMTNFSTEVGERFSKLLGAIKSSEDHLEWVRDPHWPAHGSEIFRIALWDAKRVESIEKFWQLQFERLRIYELVLDRIGNFSSLALAWAFSIVAAVALGIVAFALQNLFVAIEAAIVFVCAFLIAHRFGAISRQEKLSFDMDDIIKQGLETSWSPFAHLEYFHRIAQEIENGLGAKRINKIEGIFQGSGGGNR
jgi:hypothetical protein